MVVLNSRNSRCANIDYCDLLILFYFKVCCKWFCQKNASHLRVSVSTGPFSSTTSSHSIGFRMTISRPVQCSHISRGISAVTGFSSKHVLLSKIWKKSFSSHQYLLRELTPFKIHFVFTTESWAAVKTVLISTLTINFCN